KLREAVIKQADFPSSLVRFQTAVALAEIEGPAKLAALVKLANREASDRYVPLAIEGGIGRGVGDFLSALIRSDPAWRQKPTAAEMRFLEQVASQLATHNEPAQWALCRNIIISAKTQAPAPGDLAILTGLGQALSSLGKSPRTFETQRGEL